MKLKLITIKADSGMKKLKKIGTNFVSIALHLLAGGVIARLWTPIAVWYWNYRPVLGVDFYNLAGYVGYLARHFIFRFKGWKYVWWGGGPLAVDYPTLHAYLILPLLRVWSLPQAVQAYVLGSCFLFLFFSYLLFVEIGRDRVLGVVLAVASSFSVGLYGPLVWGGSLPYFATQVFLPLSLWLVVKFLKTTDKRWYYLSALVLGVSFLGHPQVGLSYIIPIASLLLLAYPFKGERLISFRRIKRILIFLVIAFLVGYPAMYNYLGKSPREILRVAPQMVKQIFLWRSVQVFRTVLQTESRSAPISERAPAAPDQTAADIAQFNRAQLDRLETDTNRLFFSFLTAGSIIFIISFLIRKKRKRSLRAIVFALPALWVIGYNALFSVGIGLFHGGWYRVFWPFPLVLGMLISFIWGDFWTSVKERLVFLEKKFVLRTALVVISGVIVFLPGRALLSRYSPEKMLDQIEFPRLRQQSSAFPDSLNVYVEKKEFGELKERLVPGWLDPDDTQHRLYEADQRVNIWWNALYDLPLVKGYIEFPPGDLFAGLFYWTSIALSQSEGRDVLVESWNIPREMAYNNALFLIDWLSIKYLEAEHEKSDSYNPLTSYLAESDIFARKEKVVVPGWAQLYAWKPEESGPVVWHPEEEEFLTYYQVKDDLVSPIAHTTNASTLGVIGAEGAYHTLVRSLAAVNLNSRRVIPIKLGQFIDGVSDQDLEGMDAVVLYAYDYRNHGRAWGKLEKYVKGGGKVFIETGSEVKQTDSVNLAGGFPQQLPEIFPIKTTKQEEIGREWQLSGGTEETKGVDLGVFGPPVFEDQVWLFSRPESAEDLREGARVVLAANETPLIVAWDYGQGKVVWSGMNLPHHLAVHKNLEEAKLFKNLLEGFISTEAVSYADFEVERKSPNKVIINGSKAKGVFFRENSNPGWQARLNSEKKKGKLKVYQAGPTYYGFSYVRIPEEAGESLTVTFSYKGEFWVYFWTVVSLITALLVVDRVFFGARLLTPRLKKMSGPLRKKVGGWWEKEEED